MNVEWHELTIPDSSPKVAVARLRKEDGGAFWALVRFPAGWARPVSGRYMVEEEFWILEGELELNDVTYRLGEGELVPAGAVRKDTRSPRGALVIARFGGPATWVPEQ